MNQTDEGPEGNEEVCVCILCVCDVVQWNGYSSEDLVLWWLDEARLNSDLWTSTRCRTIQTHTQWDSRTLQRLHQVTAFVSLIAFTPAGRSGLAVTRLTAVWEDQGLNPTIGSCMFIVNITTIYSLGHGLCTLIAVPRPTQPCTLRGMVKWVSAFGLSNNNKWRWWVWLLAAYRLTHSPGRLAWSEGRRPLGAVPYSSYEPGELSQWLWATMTAP